jgi:hypothetical protein
MNRYGVNRGFPGTDVYRGYPGTDVYMGYSGTDVHRGYAHRLSRDKFAKGLLKSRCIQYVRAISVFIVRCSREKY